MSWDQEAAEAMCRAHLGQDVPIAIVTAADPRARVAACFDCQRRASALAPVVAREVARAKAEALREAAGDYSHLYRVPRPSPPVAAVTCVDLEARADAHDPKAGGS